LPHAQVIVASSYFGWMSLFMIVPYLSKLSVYYSTTLG
jgi:hypothetical protein